jgi:hypothetical protein
MIIEHSDFSNGHDQNEHFGHDHNAIFIIKWSKLTDISTISTNFNNLVMNHDQIWNDHFNHENAVIMRMVVIS